MDYRESAKSFEPYWRRYWAESRVFRTPNLGEPGFDASRPKFVVLDFFPYPSGIGLHIGHPLGYIATDVLARYKAMSGFNVLHAMGFDSFGLPAEQYAVQTGQHPRVTTERNIANMLEQLTALGLAHDPERTFATSDPDYYRWTQWLFLRLFDSYYDQWCTWQGPGGEQVQGRARPVHELAERLRSGAWLVDAARTPAPAERLPAGRRLDDDEIASVVDASRLAVLADMPVNWCPDLGTVLSNEEVTSDGRSERGNYPVYLRDLKQWVLCIRHYADRLLSGLDGLDWPSGIVQMQKDWIGRSEGLELSFPVRGADGEGSSVRVFTTRPETLAGATFLVLAPEHPLVDALTLPGQRDVIAAAVRDAVRSRRERTTEPDAGAFTGSYVRNPLTGVEMPIYIATYVLLEYGTGAVMAVPAHDERDFVFAVQKGLPVVPVLAPPTSWLQERAAAKGLPTVGSEGTAPANDLQDAYMADPVAFGVAFSGRTEMLPTVSGDGLDLAGRTSAEAAALMTEWAVSQCEGAVRTTYRLRDWLFSRQRYWGEPFPVVTDVETGRVYALDESELPLRLPDLVNFQPEFGLAYESAPRPPLARAEGWVDVEGWITNDGTVVLGPSSDPARPTRRFQRDSNTMPNWAGSCWYYLRYFDARNAEAFVGAKAERYWSTGSQSSATGAVDLYVGGAEHAVLHLLYARFWHKVLFDLSLVSTPEPFAALFNQGMITADAFHDERGVYVDVHDVEVTTDEQGRRTARRRSDGKELIIQPGKMGKRYRNGIPPEEVGQQYTFDTLRTYEMFLGPLDATKPWQPDDIVGCYRWLRNVWRMGVDRERFPLVEEASDALVVLRHQTVKRVSADIEALRLNKAIAALMEWVNVLQKQEAVAHEDLRQLILLTSPFAPHLGEELASRVCPEEHAQAGSVIKMPWPEFDEKLTEQARVRVPVQVNTRTRAVIEVAVDIDATALEQLARDAVARDLVGREVTRVIVKISPVPRVVSFVAA